MMLEMITLLKTANEMFPYQHQRSETHEIIVTKLFHKGQIPISDIGLEI